MKTFSRLTMLFVFLGIAFMLVGGTAEAQDPFLEVVGSDGFDPSATVGTPLTVIFEAGYDGAGESGIQLRITATPNINITSPIPVPGTHMTGVGGKLTVKGTLQQANVSTSVRAVWSIPGARELNAEAKISAGDEPAPLVIVVNSPEDENNQKLQSAKITDIFTQTITLENRDSRRRSLPLSAWQMDVVYNPLILKVVSVTEGDLLMKDDPDAAENTVSTHYIEQVSSGRIRASQSRPGHTDNDPMSPDAKDGMDDEATASSPAGIELKPGDIGTLLTITLEVLAVAEEPLGIHNVRLQSGRDHDKLGGPDRISYSILVTDVLVATKQSSEPVDVNQDGDVNILDLVTVAGSIASVPQNPRADVNGDGFVNVLDLITIYTSAAWAGTVPLVDVAKVNEVALAAPSTNRHLNPAVIQTWIDLAQVEDDGSAIFDLGIANLEALLASRIPSDTRLLLNYPNPFNPETWIPYQLAEATDVRVMIHSVNGSLIRMLELGHQAAGTYKNKSQAAYWDGRNELGEQVASGLYFYTLTAGDFSATGKMLIRK